jgi:hypothetical protein
LAGLSASMQHGHTREQIVVELTRKSYQSRLMLT